MNEQGLASQLAGMGGQPSPTPREDINQEIIRKVAALLAQGISPDDLLAQGVPPEIIEQALRLVQNQVAPQVSEDRAGLAGMVTKGGMQ